MAEISEADRYLIDRIRGGDSDGWSQLVERYQGRLLAFARSRLQKRADAEDLVQETFLAFLQALGSFKHEYSVETFLFTILRRRIIDQFRGRASHVCSLQEAMSGRDDSDASSGAERLADSAGTASFYMRRQEQDERLGAALGQALDAYVDRLKQGENFRDLKIIEMLFHAQLRNKDVAKVMGMDEKQIALIKHRALKEVQANFLSQQVVGPRLDLEGWDESDQAESLMTSVWEQRRPTCPKRSTVGRFVLGTLEQPWREYVEFHLHKLGCRLCLANLEDLQKQNRYEPQELRDRIFQSTVGFLKRA
jgi:RNA polymerase sigma factor (sigma-70 family)